jgi:uncharacterized membrane protein
MLNLDKINSQFDINNLDASQITNILTEHQKTIIIVLIVGSLLMAAGIFNDHHAKETALRARMSQEQEKLGVIKSRDAALADLNHFKSSMPKQISEFELITQISNDANLYHVNIASLSPADNKDMGLYDVTDLSFTAVSDNFKDMMLFLRKIEKSDSPVTVNTWSGHEGDDGKISFNIEISAVHIHP